jgi:hypothetical protein
MAITLQQVYLSNKEYNERVKGEKGERGREREGLGVIKYEQG